MNPKLVIHQFTFSRVRPCGLAEDRGAGGDFDPEEFDLKEFSNLARGVENMENLWK